MDNLTIFNPKSTWRIVIICSQATRLDLWFKSSKQNARAEVFQRLPPLLILYFLEPIANREMVAIAINNLLTGLFLGETGATRTDYHDEKVSGLKIEQL
ncbi:hypothetical protein A6S26_05705 [Nostoc sp. ATCC 43529]|nr:hypothetical protein A6S26_05705 [Nostoc sp. ATCC 43529]